MMGIWPRLSWPPNSMSVRLVLWYSLWAVALIAGASGLLYGGLETQIEKEQDNRVLADYLRILNIVLHPSEGAPATEFTSTAALPVGDDDDESYVYVRMVDGQGHILLETPGLSAQLPVPQVEELAHFTTEGRRSTWRSSSGRLFELLSARTFRESEDGTARYLQIVLDRTEDDLLDRLRDQSWLVLALTVAACALVGYTIAQRSIRPVKEIGLAMQRIQSNRLDERVDTSGLPRELSDLAGTFNQMLDRIEDSFRRVAEFSDNVAHELRTPIGNIRGAMEVALQKARSEEDYRDVVASCLEENERITRILQGLLLLARSGSAQPLQLETMLVLGELESLREVYEPMAAERDTKIEIDAPETLAAVVDRTLARQAIANLIANAVEHTGPSGRIRIEARAEAAWVVVSVADTGCGIAPEHLPHVFERFYRIDKARTDSPRHAGLGLAIVKTLVEQHGGRVAIESRVQHGTTVKIWLPRSSDSRPRSGS